MSSTFLYCQLKFPLKMSIYVFYKLTQKWLQVFGFRLFYGKENAVSIPLISFFSLNSSGKSSKLMTFKSLSLHPIFVKFVLKNLNCLPEFQMNMKINNSRRIVNEIWVLLKILQKMNPILNMYISAKSNNRK